MHYLQNNTVSVSHTKKSHESQNSLQYTTEKQKDLIQPTQELSEAN
jgi:hypothetical protein